MKVVINGCYGGFSISKECAEYMEKLGSKQAKAELDEWKKNKKEIDYYLKHGKFRGAEEHAYLEIDARYKKEPSFYGYGYTGGFDGYRRDDKYLVEAVEKLGSKKASGYCAELRVVEIPDGTDYYIDEYDGLEHVAEKHQTW